MFIEETIKNPMAQFSCLQLNWAELALFLIPPSAQMAVSLPGLEVNKLNLLQIIGRPNIVEFKTISRNYENREDDL